MQGQTALLAAAWTAGARGEAAVVLIVPPAAAAVAVVAAAVGE